MPEQILFMKTGGPGCAPPNFFDDLTQRYEAVRHDSSVIKEELSGVKTSMKFQQEITRQITRERTVKSLEDGHNVVYDGYLNLSKNREELREAVSHVSGLIIVGLAIITPRHVREDRIIAKKGFSPGEELPDHLSQFIFRTHQVQRHVEWPKKEEKDCIVLEGTLETPALLSTISRHVENRRSRRTPSTA